MGVQTMSSECLCVTSHGVSSKGFQGDCTWCISIYGTQISLVLAAWFSSWFFYGDSDCKNQKLIFIQNKAQKSNVSNETFHY